MKKGLLKTFTLIFLISSMIFTLSCKNKIPAPRTVRIAIQPSAAFLPLYVARYSKFIEDALITKNVTVIWQDFESGPPINESLTADLSDIGVLGDVPTVRALSFSNRMKLVGISARGANAYAMLSRADSKINSYKDLKNKKIATVFGSTGHNFTKKLLEKSGLSLEDIEFINIAAGDSERVLKNEIADAVVIWEPTITRLTEKGIAKIVAQGDETNLQGTNTFVVREEYLSENADIITEILNQYARATEILPNLDSTMLFKLSGAFGISNEQIKSILKKYDFSTAIKPEDIDALQDTIAFLVSINNLPHEYRVEDFLDTTCLK